MYSAQDKHRIGRFTMKTLIAAFILTLTLTTFSFAGENMADCDAGTANNVFDIADQQPISETASSSVK